MNDHDGYGQARSKDLIYWEAQQYPRTTSDFEGTRVKAKIAGHEETGTVSQVPWSVVDGLTQTYERNQYRNSLYGERPVQDKERFAGLKSVKATVTAQPEETKEISDLLMGIFFEDINYSADGGLYAELIQNRTSNTSRPTVKGTRTGTAPIHGSWKEKTPPLPYRLRTLSIRTIRIMPS